MDPALAIRGDDRSGFAAPPKLETPPIERLDPTGPNREKRPPSSDEGFPHHGVTKKCIRVNSLATGKAPVNDLRVQFEKVDLITTEPASPEAAWELHWRFTNPPAASLHGAGMP